MYKVVTLLAMMVLLASCSKNPYESYLGLWQREAVNAPQVLQISKDGDTYLADENILTTKDLFGNTKKSMVLSKSEGQLSVSNGFGTIQMGLSADKNTLHIGDREYKRVSSAQVEEIKAKIEKDRIEREKNVERCKSLNDEFAKEKSALGEKVREVMERVKQERALAEQYQAKTKEIPNCALTSFFF